MRRRRGSPQAGRGLLLVTTAALWLACGGGGELTAPTTGALEVTTSTTGQALDPDGYTLSVDGVEVRAIGVAAAVTLAELTPGPHRLGLAGVASNCTVQGANPRTLTIIAGETAVEAIAVVCAEAPPPTGDLTVTTVTSGDSPDPDGYSVTVDGGGGRSIDATGSVAIQDLSPGSHLVGLGGIAANCTVAGDNPRAVTVVAGGVVGLDFTIDCGTPPPATGTLRVTTATSGPSPDPDGYLFAVGGGPGQPIGASATVTVANVEAGATTVELSGMAANCAVGGQNPRTVTVPAGGTADVEFAVTCTAGTGNLAVTTTSTGAPADPSGYTVSVDGGPAVRIAVNATLTIEGVPTGQRSIRLGDVAGNCAVQGQNPRNVSIAASQTATVGFTVTCSATTGSLAIRVAGLPDGVAAAIVVTGPSGFRAELTSTETLDDLVPGQYTMSAGSVTSGPVTYTPSPRNRTVAVASGAAAEVAVTYAAASSVSLNLRIAGLNITQSVQSFGNEVPLVAGRDALLRVVVLANESNRATPEVRVRLYDGGTLVETITIPAPADTVPTGRMDNVLGTTWNSVIPGARIRRGLRVLAEVDPSGLVPEADETDNAFPVGGPQTQSVRSAPPLSIMMVPVRQSANQLQGDVTTANRDRYLDFTQRIHPIPGYDAVVHAVYTTTTPDALQADNANGAWNAVLSEMSLLRLTEDSERHYYGVVRIGYPSGLAGVGFIGLPVALGYDDPADRGRIVAHELGHTWGRRHANCGGADNPDPNFPHPNGTIGRIGYDIRDGILKERTTPDVMGYCANPWISDYTYQGVMDFRGTAPGLGASARAQPSLLVWGRIVNGRAVLEPAFQVVTRPALPAGPGAYAIEGTARDGSRVFGLTFDAAEVADDPRGARHFAFAVPLDERSTARLQTIRLAGPGVGMAAISASPASLRAGPAKPVTATRAAGGVAIQWDAAAQPMVMVRDAASGEVLSLARGGSVVIPTGGSAVELVMSDGVRSSTAVVSVGR